MWRIALERADVEPVEFCQDLELPKGVGGEDALGWGPARLTGRLARRGEGYVVSGSVQVIGQLQCVRCLEGFPFSVQERFSLRLLPLALAPSEEEVQLTRRDLDVLFFAEPFLDLELLAAEQVELALPVKPLCQEDCRGLCPQCGSNLNQGACPCPPQVDERWRKLGDLFPPS
ncbi:MAG: DUF177 domain-containing protein [Thermoanaerobaculum sp.]|nr:DUF177 domain-containing protein [Thermoanaerobaculum sp.]